jgi:hypothetical protein
VICFRFCFSSVCMRFCNKNDMTFICWQLRVLLDIFLSSVAVTHMYSYEV